MIPSLSDDLRAFFDMLVAAEPTGPTVCAVMAERNRRLLAERGPELVARLRREM